ncbi:hypothetical protein [Devosia sp. RR2S18]|nr:hypothetical protein [Devosia sp. RR2S18]WIJ23979.1 hypothetical protein QOV41_13145 [Devosia sp. RR2S18]
MSNNRLYGLKGRTNLDTGAVFTGRLVVGMFDDVTPDGPVEIIDTKRRP